MPDQRERPGVSAAPGPARSVRARTWNWLAPSLIVLLALGLRLYRVDSQSVWNDEAFSITTAAMSPGAMTGRLIEDAAHPPLHYWLLDAWFAAVGYGALEARMLSVLFGTLAVAMTYVLASGLFGRRAGLLSAMLLAVSQLGVMYSQEARPYAQFFFLVLSSTYLFIRMLRERRPVIAWWFLVSAIALVYTDYFGSLVLLCFAGFSIARRKEYPLPLRWWVAGGLILAAAYAPWIAGGVVPEALEHARRALPPGPKAYFAAHSWSLASAVNWFNNGKWRGANAASPWWTFIAGAVVFTFPAVLALKRGSRPLPERDGVLLAALLCVAPLLAVFALGLAGFRYNVRYVAFCALPYYLLAARGTGLLPCRRVFAALMIVYSAGALRAAYFVPYKENYRDALAYVASGYRDRDCSVFIPGNRVGAARMSWDVYHRGHPLTIVDFTTIRSGAAKCARVWLIRDIWSLESIANARDESQSEVDRALSLQEENHFEGVTVRLYIPKPSLNANSAPPEPAATVTLAVR